MNVITYNVGLTKLSISYEFRINTLELAKYIDERQIAIRVYKNPHCLKGNKQLKIIVASIIRV